MTRQPKGPRPLTHRKAFKRALRLDTIAQFHQVIRAAQQAIRLARQGQSVEFPQAPRISRMTPKLRALSRRYDRLRMEFSRARTKGRYRTYRGGPGPIPADFMRSGMLPSTRPGGIMPGYAGSAPRGGLLPSTRPGGIMPGYAGSAPSMPMHNYSSLGQYYGHTTFQRSRPLTLDPFSSSLPLRGLGFSLLNANGVQGCGQGISGFGVGFDESDPLTKKQKRKLNKEANAAALAWLETAIANLQNAIQGYMDGSVAPNATVSFTAPPFTTSDKNQKVKNKAKKYEKLRSRDLPRAQTWAREKAETEGWDEVPSLDVLPPPSIPPPTAPPTTLAPTTPSDTTGIQDPGGSYGYDGEGNGFQTDLGPYGGGIVYPDAVTPGAGSTFIVDTMMPTPDAEGVFENGTTEEGVARQVGDELIWIGGIAAGLAAIIALFYMMKKR